MIQATSLLEKPRIINSMRMLSSSFKDAIPPEDLPHLRPFALAKDAWLCVVSLDRGSVSIQRSNYEVVQDEADEFAMKEDEEPRELYRRLTTLAVSLRDQGSKDTNENWIKHKFLKAMMPDMSILHHAFISIFIALWIVITHYSTILMPFLSYFIRFT